MKDIRPAILLFIIFTVICGGIYPAVVTGVAYALFPKQAAGSFITDKGDKEIGSTLIVPRLLPTLATTRWPRAAPIPVPPTRIT